MLQLALQGKTYQFNVVMTKEDTFGLHVITQLMIVPALERNDLIAKINNIFNVKEIELSQRQESLVLNELNAEINAENNNGNVEISAANSTE